MNTVRIGLGAFAIAAVAAAVVHHPSIRGRLFGAGSAVGCPHLGSASEIGEARRAALAALAGTTAAPEKKVFGLAIGRDTRSSVRAWAEARELRCDNSEDALRCSHATSVLGVESDLFLRFNKDTLVAIDAVGSVPKSEPTQAYHALEQDLISSYGPAHQHSALGDLASTGRVASTWRFAELAIDLSVFAAGDLPRLRVQVRALR